MNHCAAAIRYERTDTTHYVIGYCRGCAWTSNPRTSTSQALHDAREHVTPTAPVVVGTTWRDRLMELGDL